ncbi:hypothetical protein Tco_1475708 [Tanacetum coccineum]
MPPVKVHSSSTSYSNLPEPNTRIPRRLPKSSHAMFPIPHITLLLEIQEEGIDFEESFAPVARNRRHSEYFCQCRQPRTMIIYPDGDFLSSEECSIWAKARALRACMTPLSKFLMANNFFKGAVDPTSYGFVIVFKRDELKFQMSVDGTNVVFLSPTNFSKYQDKHYPKSTLKAINRVFRILKGTFHMGLWSSKDNHVTIQLMQDGIMRDVMISRRSSREVPSFWEIDCSFAETMEEQNVPAQTTTRTESISTSLSVVNNREKQPTVQCTKDPKEPHLSDISGHSEEYQLLPSIDCISKCSCYLPAIVLEDIKALAITPVNPTHPFELPPSGDTVLDFVNELGYPEPVELVSSIRTNYVYQPWRAILSLLNQCLTGKTSGSDKPRHPVLQMLWGIVTQTNVDHAELIWEEFTQGIQTFFSHKASHKASLKNPKKKATPLLIPYGRFSKVIIYYLASNNNIHRRPDSAVHHTGDDYVLGNLKFVPKGETVEVFGMAIPDPLITEAIQQSSYYPKYLKMVAANTKKTPQGSASMQPLTKEDEAQQESNPQKKVMIPILELAKKLSLETHQEKGKGEGDDADLELAIKLSLDPALLPQSQAPVGGVTIRDPVSETTPKLHEVVGKGKAVVSEEQVAHSLIDMSKKKRSTDQFILARRDQTPPDSTTGPSSQPDDDTSDKEIHEPSSTSDLL